MLLNCAYWFSSSMALGSSDRPWLYRELEDCREKAENRIKKVRTV
jgi:hypothetical protein